MKYLTMVIAFCLLAISVFADPVHITSWNIENDINTLNDMHISIDSVNRNTGTIIAYVRNESEYQAILATGMDAERIPNLAKDYALQLRTSSQNSDDPDRAYYTLANYHTFMQETATQYPDICQLVQIGTSVQGRPLYFMKISDNVAIQENEPELRYISSIHGDEVVGYDMLIRLIQLLTTEYTETQRIADIVNNTEIWICPMMNPDGYNSSTRYNADGIDLNRNFPMPSGNQHPDGNAWATENIAMMNFSNEHSFDLSLNFHGGELVLNYPWDYTYTLAPDDALLQEMALTYTRPHTGLYNSTDFTHGITNGAQWYVITGSMQDWFYGITGCIDITAEISRNKWPSSSQLPNYWNLNKESMLRYIEFAQNGAKGLVTDYQGNPLSAVISIAGNTKTKKNDPDVGDYHRLLLPGTYNITATVDGYEPQTTTVSVPTTGHVIQNFVFGNGSQVYDQSIPASDLIHLNVFPNPFNNNAKISFELPQADDRVTLQVFNLKGQLVTNMLNSNMKAGIHTTQLTIGDNLPSGIYFCRLSTSYGSKTYKFVHQK